MYSRLHFINERKSKVELNKILKLKFADNEFNNIGSSFMDYPNLAKYFDSELKKEGLRLICTSYGKDKSVPVGFFELQRHTASVEPHTDELSKGRYFALFTAQNKTLPNQKQFGRYFYESTNELRYYDENGKRQSTKLLEHTLLVFNPNKQHEMIFYGDYSTLLLFTVEKDKPCKSRSTSP